MTHLSQLPWHLYFSKDRILFRSSWSDRALDSCKVSLRMIDPLSQYIFPDVVEPFTLQVHTYLFYNSGYVSNFSPDLFLIQNRFFRIVDPWATFPKPIFPVFFMLKLILIASNLCPTRSILACLLAPILILACILIVINVKVKVNILSRCPSRILCTHTNWCLCLEGI